MSNNVTMATNHYVCGTHPECHSPGCIYQHDVGYSMGR